MSDEGSAAAALLAELPAELLDQLAEAIADRLADKLEGRQAGAVSELLDAAALARRLGCSRDWVYEHADALGAIRLGGGRRPRLAFDPAQVDAYLAARQATRPDPPEPSPTPRTRRGRRQPQATDVPLLPIRPGSV